MKSSHAFAAAAVLFLCAAPLSIAQTTAPPSTAAAPATPAAPTTPPADPSATTPAAPATPATPAAPDASSSTTADAGSTVSCRTHKAEGERCSCRSAPTDFGTAQSQNGHNVCVAPKS